MGSIFIRCCPAHRPDSIRSQTPQHGRPLGHCLQSVLAFRPEASCRQHRRTIYSADRIVGLQPKAYDRRPSDHCVCGRRARMVIRQQQYRSYRCQRDHLRSYRLFNVYRCFPPGMGGASLFGGDSFQLRRSAPVSTGLQAGNQLVGSFFWVSIRCHGRLVDKIQK